MPQDMASSPTAAEHVNKPEGSSAFFTTGNISRAGVKAKSSDIRNFMSCLKCRQRKLKCDRIEPACSTCTRVNHVCEYPMRRRSRKPNRMSYKQLEAKLIEIETKPRGIYPDPILGHVTPIGFSECETGVEDKQQSFETSSASVCSNRSEERDSSHDVGTSLNVPSRSSLVDLQPQDMMELDIYDVLPSNVMQQELFEIYFDKIHHQIPIIHKGKLLAALDLGLNLRPPVCLLYSVWALAAFASSRYEHLAEVFYQRSRQYAEAAEIMGHGEDFITVYMAQCWCLIGKYEASMTYLSRAWFSTGKYIRLVQIMGFSLIDVDEPHEPQKVMPAENVIELETRRRTFWMAFCNDRWASAATGSPLAIAESSIYTNLPCSEEAFENGKVESTLSLHEILKSDNLSKLSSLFTGRIIASLLIGRNYNHIHQTDPNEHPEDFINGAFWERHREMDNILSNFFFRLPENLKLHRGLNNMEVVFLNLTFHMSSICLHQASILTAEKQKLDPFIQIQSLRRCLIAADEIIHTMRLVSHQDLGHMNHRLGYCLYVAGSVYIYDLKIGQPPSPHSSSNLKFLLATLYTIGNRLPIMNHFSTQIEFDLECAGLTLSPEGMEPGYTYSKGLAILDTIPDASAAYISTSNILEIRTGKLKLLPPVSGIVLRGWTNSAIQAVTLSKSRIISEGHITESLSPFLHFKTQNPVSQARDFQANAESHGRSSQLDLVLDTVSQLDKVRDTSFVSEIHRTQACSTSQIPEYIFDIMSQNIWDNHYGNFEMEAMAANTHQPLPHYIPMPDSNNTQFSTRKTSVENLALNDCNTQELDSTYAFKPD